jgi:light-regulated signal transduction histidine kinase (bacteriophytochrome)
MNCDMNFPGELDSKTRTASDLILELEKRNSELEARLRRRDEEILAANRELECLTYAISHDLRAPLRGMDGLIAALNEDCAASLDDLSKDYLEQISRTGKQITGLIDGLLELSRATRGPFRLRNLNLSQLAGAIAKQYEEKHPERSVELQIEQELYHEADEQLIGVALLKLLDNAWKFTRVRELARIELRCAQQEGRRVFLIRDNGAGFDMQYADKLFGPFQRLHAVGEFPGIGIGLAVAQRIIVRHGGRIWAESKPDSGATFYFTLSG